MGERRKYRKKPGSYVVAVRLEIDTEGFRYRKWGSEQFCSAGDWLVNNFGDTYTVSHKSFVSTYEEVSAGVYRKISVVWAEAAESSGQVLTKEGKTAYNKEDYLVFNNEDGTDVYAVRKEKFESMYDPDD